MTEHALFYSIAGLAGVSAFVLLAAAGRSRRLNASAQKGTMFDRLGGQVHLRDIFNLALSLEEDGIFFYSKLAERSRNPAVRELCRALVEEEKEHRALFKRQLDAWRPLPAHRILFPALLEQVREKGIFGHPPDPDAGEEEMAGYAIDQEVKTVEFYRSFEHAFPEAWKRAEMHKLVAQEQSHEARLRAVYPDLAK